MWKRSHGYTTKAPPDERGGNRYVQPKATAPHLDSTMSGGHRDHRTTSGLPQTADMAAARSFSARGQKQPLRSGVVCLYLSIACVIAVHYVPAESEGNGENLD